MSQLLVLALLSLSWTLLAPPLLAQEEQLESSNTIAEEPDNFSCTQEQADEGTPIGTCDIGTEGCTGYQYYQYAPRASEAHGEIRCIASQCSEPVTCPSGVTVPDNVPLAPQSTVGSDAVEGMDFSLATSRLMDPTDASASCGTLAKLLPQARAAHTLWLGLSDDAQDCPQRITAPWEYFTTIITNPESGLSRNFIPAEETITPTSENPLRKLLSGFLSFLKNAWGI